MKDMIVSLEVNFNSSTRMSHELKVVRFTQECININTLTELFELFWEHLFNEKLLKVRKPSLGVTT